MLQVLTAILPLFMIIALGAAIARMPLANSHMGRVLNQYAYYLGLPALIFTALAALDFTFAEQGKLVIINSVYLVGVFGVALLVCKLMKVPAMMTRTLVITLGFANVGYLGIPILTRLFGDGITGEAATLVAVYVFWNSTIGIGYLDYSLHKRAGIRLAGTLKHLIKNPLLISAFLGTAAGLLRVKIPGIFMEPLSMIASSVTPIILLVIGLFVGKMQFGKLREWGFSVGYSLVRLLVMPAVLVGLLWLVGEMPSDFHPSVLDAAMPFAITPFALAPLYHLDQPFIARNIMLSIILSVLTIPIWMTIL